MSRRRAFDDLAPKDPGLTRKVRGSPGAGPEEADKKFVFPK